MTAVVAAFNQEKALVGAFSVIVQPVVEPMDRFIALLTGPPPVWPGPLVDHGHHRTPPVGLKLQQNALAKAKPSGYGEPENANNWQICAMVTATGQNQKDSAE